MMRRAWRLVGAVRFLCQTVKGRELGKRVEKHAQGVIVFGATAKCGRGRGERVEACDAGTRSEHSRSPSAQCLV